MISYTAQRKPPLKPIEFRIFNNDIGLGIVGCLCHMTRERVTVAHIQATVAAHFSIPAYEMRTARRDRIVARPRQIAMYFAKELTPHSLPAIGGMFGKRDHTTVMHAVRRVKSLCASDAKVAADVSALRERLAA